MLSRADIQTALKPGIGSQNKPFDFRRPKLLLITLMWCTHRTVLYEKKATVYKTVTNKTHCYWLVHVTTICIKHVAANQLRPIYHNIINSSHITCSTLQSTTYTMRAYRLAKLVKYKNVFIYLRVSLFAKVSGFKSNSVQSLIREWNI